MQHRCTHLELKYLIVEKPDLEDVLHVLHAVGHVQISQRVPEQQHVGPRPQLLEVAGVEHRTLSFVVNVDQLPFESSQDSL